MEEVILRAPGISCDHCIVSIQKAVSRLAGVQFLKGSPETKEVVIRYDPSLVKVMAIEKAMEEEGYPVAR